MGFELTYNEVFDWKNFLSHGQLIPDIKQWTFTMVIYNFDVGQGPLPERCNNSIPGINVPYSRNNFIPGINSVGN